MFYNIHYKNWLVEKIAQNGGQNDYHIRLKMVIATSYDKKI